MTFGEIIRARYVGRARNLKDTLSILEQQRQKDSDAFEALVSRTRSTLAEQLRASRSRIKRIEQARAADHATTRLAEKLLELQQSYQDAVKDIRKDCLALAQRIASEVLAADSDLLTRTLDARINRELKRLRSSSGIMIEVHPDDLLVLKQSLDAGPASNSLHLTPDTKLMRGEANIITPVGSLTISWRHHLDFLQNEILKALAQSSSTRARKSSR